MKHIIVAAALCAAAAGGAWAQGEPSASAPISVETDTQPVPAGATIVLRGRTIAADDRKPIALTVTWQRSLSDKPIGAVPPPDTLSAAYGPDGAYQVPYQVGREGLWRVDARSPDGSGRASTEFKVTGFEDWSGDQGKTLVEALDVSSQLVESLRQLVAQQPDSPAKQQFEARLAPLKNALAQRQPAAGALGATLAYFGRFAAEAPAAAPALDALIRELKEFKRNADSLLPQLRAASAEAKARNQVCDDLVKVEEGFKLLSTMINFVGKAYQVILAFSIDFAANVAGNKAPASCADTCKFAFTQAVKRREWVRTGAEQAKARALDAKAYFEGLPGFLADAGAFATHALFDRYCQRFEGPVEGRMKAEYVKDGQTWWRYTIQIKGTMTLVYRKGADSARPIPMAGHLVGTGTQFTVAEPALRVLNPKLLAGAAIMGRTIAPTGLPYSDFAGVLALLAVPTAFFHVVEGELQDGKLRLKLGATRKDFDKDYTVAKGRYAIAGGYAGMMMGYTTFDVGYDSSRGLVEKATDMDKKPLELKVDVGKDKMTATGTFDGRRGSGVKARGEYELKITLCNPKC